MSLTNSELEQFVEQLTAERDRWEHLVHHADDVRVYELIWEDDDVNAWVICWSEDQDTGFHDHDESAAAIVVIQGEVREERLRLAGNPEVRVIGAGQKFSLAPTAIHRVLHSGIGTAVTIHAYSPPLTRTGAYRVGSDGTLERAAQSYEEELRGDPVLT